MAPRPRESAPAPSGWTLLLKQSTGRGSACSTLGCKSVISRCDFYICGSNAQHGFCHLCFLQPSFKATCPSCNPTRMDDAAAARASKKPKVNPPDAPPQAPQPPSASFQDSVHIVAALVQYLGRGSREAALDTLAELKRLAPQISHDQVVCHGCKVVLGITAYQEASGQPYYCGCNSAAESYPRVLLEDRDHLDRMEQVISAYQALEQIDDMEPSATSGFLIDSKVHQNIEELKAELAQFTDDMLRELAKKLGIPENSTVDQVLKAHHRGAYLVLNMEASLASGKTPLAQFALDQRKGEYMSHSTAAQFGKGSTCVVLAGNKGTGTPLHGDYAEAYNVGMAASNKYNKNLPIAAWLFVRPADAPAFDLFLRTDGRMSAMYPQGLETERHGQEQVLSLEDMEYVVRMFGSVGAGGRGRAFIVKQFAGDRVYVPTGWLHSVINLQNCVKIAWDFVVVKHLSMYLKTYQDVLSKFTKGANVPDYIGVIQIVLSLFMTAVVAGRL